VLELAVLVEQEELQMDKILLGIVLHLLEAAVVLAVLMALKLLVNLVDLAVAVHTKMEQGDQVILLQ
tara:strand:+ start:381 stop:581 length:201 start_codon:yes stop_codon:yes gene_type:complete